MEPHAMVLPDRLEHALNWLRRHRSLEEVLITGGDPLMLPTRSIEAILNTLSGMPHIKRLRIGSRAPVVLPMRFTRALLDVFFTCAEEGQGIGARNSFRASL